MKRYLYFVSGIFILVFFLGFMAQSNEQSDKSQITEISFERTLSRSGSAIKIVLHSDGTATFIGGHSAERVGTFRGVINDYAFSRLSQSVQSQGFFNLKQSGVAAHGPSIYTVSVVRNNTRKTITDNGGGFPVELWSIAMTIRGAAADIRWEQQKSPPN